MVDTPVTRDARSGETSIACRVVGSGDDRGERALKGLDGTWRSYAASAP